MMPDTPRIAVIGGGVIGIGTTYAILKAFPNVKLTIYSKEFTPNTTSDGAGGIWEPFECPGTSEKRLIDWSTETWELLGSWFAAKKVGVSLREVRAVSREEMKIPFWSHVPFNFTVMDQAELKPFGPDYVCGHKYSAYVAEPRLFLPGLMDEIQELGGSLVKAALESLTELANVADLIINCTGIASHDLVPDKNVLPVRGQVFRVKAPWVKSCTLDESEETCAYVIPNTNSVVLGGTVQYHDWRTTIDPEDSRRIWENCTNIVPELKTGQIVEEWAGLRPARRNGVRVEEDELFVNSKKISIIHNYGHGGSGVTLFWGCSNTVKELVRKFLNKFYLPVKEETQNISKNKESTI